MRSRKEIRAIERKFEEAAVLKARAEGKVPEMGGNGTCGAKNMMSAHDGAGRPIKTLCSRSQREQ